MGLEPTTSELEVQRAIRCATAAMRYQKSEILRAAGGKKFHLHAWKRIFQDSLCSCNCEHHLVNCNPVSIANLRYSTHLNALMTIVCCSDARNAD